MSAEVKPLLLIIDFFAMRCKPWLVDNHRHSRGVATSEDIPAAVLAIKGIVSVITLIDVTVRSEAWGEERLVGATQDGLRLIIPY